MKLKKAKREIAYLSAMIGESYYSCGVTDTVVNPDDQSREWHGYISNIDHCHGKTADEMLSKVRAMVKAVMAKQALEDRAIDACTENDVEETRPSWEEMETMNNGN